jgi:hypothetical protein
MRVRFYKITTTNGHLTKDVIIPSCNIATAKSEFPKGDTHVLEVKFLGSYHVDILVGEHGLYFRAHMDNNRVHLNKRQKSSVGFYAKPIIPRLTIAFRPPIFTLV